MPMDRVRLADKAWKTGDYLLQLSGFVATGQVRLTPTPADGRRWQRFRSVT